LVETINRPRYDFLDIAVIIALIRVIFLHGLNNYQIVTTGNPVAFHAMPLWQQLTNLAVRFSVPVFVLVSGFKFALSHQHNPDLTYFTFIKKRFKRLIIPYFIWTVIVYFAVPLVARKVPATHPAYVNFPYVTLKTAWNILNGSIHPAYQLWFIPMLFLICCFYPPVFRKIPFWISQPLFWVLFIAIRFNHLPIPLMYPAYFVFFDLGARLASFARKPELFRKILIISGSISAGAFITFSLLRLGIAGTHHHLLEVTCEEIFAPLTIFFLSGAFFLRSSPAWLTKQIRFVWPVFIMHEPLILGQIAYIVYIRLGIQAAPLYPLVAIATLIAGSIGYIIIEKTTLDRFLF